MLVLSRFKDESIVIGKDIKVIVVGVKGDKVRLGIIAPDDTKIVRSELIKETDDEAGRQCDT